MVRPIPVLLYHAVQDDPPPQERPWAVTPATLRRHVAVLSDAGAIGLTLRDLAAHLATGTPVPERSVVITFDDGLADQLPSASALAAAGFPATVYVTAGFVGSTGYLDEPMTRELAATPGVTIGGHSVRHPHLDIVSVERMRHEIDECRRRLGEIVQDDVLHFAFPHGSHGRRERDYLAAAGWSSGAAVKNALTHCADHRFGFARVTITERTPDDSLTRLVAGEGAPLAWENERLRTRAFRYVRRFRHRAEASR
jgi:peptidoglycan/xylan/chitin deacetylase (PgdA/CDA1 family)